MNKQGLIVAEAFYSIQGEGQTSGVPAVFLRLGGCNLLCEGKGWKCDTIEVWQKGVFKPFVDVMPKNCVDAILGGAHLIITGGEPLLQQIQIVEYLKWYTLIYKQYPTIEIETNGTIRPSTSMLLRVDYWNCSPKLSNSGAGTYEVRVNEVALRAIASEGRNPSFKFVVDKQEDWFEIQDSYGFIDKEKIILMPAGDTRIKLNKVRPEIIELCKAVGVKYCDRLHIVAWNKKTGV